MKWWPKALGGRIAVALTMSVVAIVALDLAVAAWERQPSPSRRRGGAAVAPDRVASQVHATPLPAALGFRLQPTRGSIVLARRQAALSPDIAPVVEILADGQLILRRPQPLAVGPDAPLPLSREGHGAAVVLPTDDLATLSPGARGALLGLLQQWIRERPVPRQRVRLADLELLEPALRRLLTWIP